MKRNLIIIAVVFTVAFFLLVSKEDPIEKFFATFETAMHKSSSESYSLLATAGRINKLSPLINSEVQITLSKHYRVDRLMPKQAILRALGSFFKSQSSISPSVNDLEVSYSGDQAFASAVIIVKSDNGSMIFEVDCEFVQDEQNNWLISSVKQSDILEK